MPRTKERFLGSISLIMPFVAGSITGIFYESGIHVDIGTFVIRPIHVIIIILWLTMVESLRNPSLWRFLPAMIGISAAIIGGYFYNHGLFLGNSGTLVTCMAYGLLASLLLIPGFRFWKSEARNVPAVRPAKPLLWSLSALILVLILRLFNIITRYHVPNGKRSLMIAGTEVHHIIIGLFFALFILLSIYNQSLRNKSTPNLGGPLLISLALVADEISYIMIFPLTDDAFFGISSVMGVFIALAWLFIRINILKTSARPSGAY